MLAIVACAAAPSSQPVTQQAHALLAKGQTGQAVAVLESALRADPNLGEAVPLLVRAYGIHARQLLSDGYWDAAERYYRRLLALEPDRADAWRGLAEIASRRGRVERLELLLDLGRWDAVVTGCEGLLAGRLSLDRRRALRETLAWALVGKGEGAFSLQDFASALVAYDLAMQASRPIALLAKDRWAHSRLREVWGRIRKPARNDAAWWEGLRRELREILQVDPENRYGRYLLGVVLARCGKGERARQRFVELVGTPAAGKLSGAKLQKAAYEAATAGGIRLSPRILDKRWRTLQPGPWRKLQSDNFVVFHRNAFAAARIIRAAEFLCAELSAKWLGSPPKEAWRPRCEIRVYPNAEAYAKGTGRDISTPAHSSIASDGRRIVGRRIDCRQDDPHFVRSILPHELTHVIVHPLFLPGKAPRWADEGMATVAEHAEKRGRYEVVLRRALAANGTIPLSDLLRMRDYPSGDRLNLFYAQSGSLVEFFLSRRGREDLLALARAEAGASFRKELARRYGIVGVESLTSLWKAWVRKRSADSAIKSVP